MNCCFEESTTETTINYNDVIFSPNNKVLAERMIKYHPTTGIDTFIDDIK